MSALMLTVDAGVWVSALWNNPMTTVRVSSRRQITIPAKMARSLGLSVGDRLILRLEGDRLIIVRAPDSYAHAFAGALRGAWGDDVDRYVEAERASWTD